MYARHFGLTGDPFSIAPDPRFLFMSTAHREALAHLLYGVQGGGGFVLLTGDIGAGKTTVCRAFLEQLPEGVEVAFVLNPRLNATELLQTVCEEFGIRPAPEGLKASIDALNAHLLARHAAGGRSLLLIDEAQNLSRDVLEQLRLLTNLETHDHKLLQIILIGQPELRRKLASPRLTQLAQRVIARFHLGPLAREDSRRYVAHRLAVAGHQGELPFDDAALKALHRLSGGVPRRLNLLAGRAMLGAYAAGRTRIGRAIVGQAAREVFETEPPSSRWPQPTRLLGVAGLSLAGGLVLGAAAWSLWRPADSGVSAALPARTSPTAIPAGAVSVNQASETGTAASTTAARPPQDASPVTAPGLTSGASVGSPASATTATPRLDAGATGGPALRDETDGWRALAQLWALPAGEGSPCDRAAELAVRCFRSQNLTLAQIRLLDRPGLVTLRGDDDTPAVALLLGSDGQQVTIRRDGAPQRLGAAAFGARWAGDFATLWRVRGEAGARPTAEWMAAQLQGLQEARGSASDQVRAFQRAQGLVADGVPGALTLMQLNRVLGVDEPRLLR